MALQALAYFTLVLVTENIDALNFCVACKAKLGRYIGIFLSKVGPKWFSSNENEDFVEDLDEDVELERSNLHSCVLNGSTSEYDLILDNITKTYDSSFIFGKPKQ